MKLVSYFQVNKQLRAERKLKKRFSIDNPSPATPKTPSKKNKSNENNHTNHLKATPNAHLPEPAGSKIKSNHERNNGIHHVQSCQQFGEQFNHKNHHDLEREKKEIEEEVLSFSPQPLVSYPDNLNLKGYFYKNLSVLL